MREAFVLGVLGVWVGLGGARAEQVVWGEVELSEGAQVHAVCAYEGPEGGGSAVVRVGAGEDPVVLVLGSYEPVEWVLDVSEGAWLEAVLVVACEGPVAPRGVPEGVDWALERGYPDWVRGADTDYVDALDSLEECRDGARTPQERAEWEARIKEHQDLKGMLVETTQADVRASWEEWFGERPLRESRAYHGCVFFVQADAGFPAGCVVHGAGVYESPGGMVEVSVGEAEAPVVLVLTSYERQRWVLSLAEEVELGGVIVSGYSSQEVEGVPEGVPVRHLDLGYVGWTEGATYEYLQGCVAELARGAWGSFRVEYSSGSVRLP